METKLKPELKEKYDACYRAGELFDVIYSEVTQDKEKLELIREFGRTLFLHGFNVGNM